MDDYPSLVILTLHNREGENVVKGILDVESVPSPRFTQDGVTSWLWEINNKYYDAKIQLTCVEYASTQIEWIHDNCEALIVYCDSSQEAALENLDSLLTSLGDFEAEVQLLVFDAFPTKDDGPGISRLKAQQWCISNRWELIELNKAEEESEDFCQDDDFPESWGFQRIRQALHAHTWSNLEMKEGSMNIPVPTLESYLEGSEGDFEKLFSNFEHMKRTAASLPTEHRKDYAEKVAISFWKAIGGSELEIDGLDSD